MAVYRTRGGWASWGYNIWDYWLTENEILKVKVLPNSVVVALFGPGFLYIFSRYVLDIPDYLVLILIIYIIVAYIYVTRRVVPSKRLQLARLSPEKVVLKEGMVADRIIWSKVTSAELKGKKLTVRWNKKKLKTKLIDADVAPIQEWIRSKIGMRLKVKV